MLCVLWVGVCVVFVILDIKMKERSVQSVCVVSGGGVWCFVCGGC